MEFLNKALESVNHIMSAPVLASIAVGIEIVCRMVKTEKPLGWAYMIADGFKKLGDLMSKVGQLMDKVLPQRTK